MRLTCALSLGSVRLLSPCALESISSKMAFNIVGTSCLTISISCPSKATNGSQSKHPIAGCFLPIYPCFDIQRITPSSEMVELTNSPGNKFGAILGFRLGSILLGLEALGSKVLIKSRNAFSAFSAAYPQVNIRASLTSIPYSRCASRKPRKRSRVL